MTYEREELHEMFRNITNIVQPEHPYKDTHERTYGEVYPIRKNQLETSWRRCDSSTWAACGPRSSGGNKAFIAFDLEYMNNASIERILCIINHELTHIEEGSHTHGSAHNPAFWNAVVENAKIILDNKEVVEDIIEQRFNAREFIEEVVNEPNNSMTDGRIETPEERQEKMREQLDGYTLSESRQDEMVFTLNAD